MKITNNKYLCFLGVLIMLSISGCVVETPEGSPVITSDIPGSNGINFIFSKGLEGYNCYRIPALLRVSDKVLLAFAEGRKTGCGDSGNIDMVLKRSIDNGRNWSQNIIVWDDAENTCGNPAPVFDKDTGEILLLTSWNNDKVFLIKSSDLGLTWNTPEEITEDVKPTSWTWYATGPGSGIQIKNGPNTGRLVVGCDHNDQGRSYSHVIYSDDHGANWSLGGINPLDNTNECEVAELSNNDLMLNMRNTDGSQKRRKVSISSDGGLSWNYRGIDNTLVSPVVQSSLHRYSFVGDEINENILLFSNPADVADRKNMTLRISNDDGNTWLKSIRLNDGFAAYSDLANYPNKRAAILYEAGYTPADRYQGISFETINIENDEQ